MEKVAEQSGVVNTRGGILCKGKRGPSWGEWGNKRGTIRRPGNISVRDLMFDKRFIGLYCNFRGTGVGKVKAGVVFLSIG